MKGKLSKVITFFIVVGLVASMAIISNVLPIKVSKDVQNLEQQPEAAMTKLDTITGWNNRVWSYATHYGPSNEMAWGFYDTNTSNKYNNIYCVQTGKSVTNSDTYYVYDIYDLDSASITKYFGNETNYHHFLYILENMYLVGRSGNDKTYMENTLINKIKEVTGVDYRANYNNSLSEINGLNIVDNYDAKSTSNSNTISYMLWKNGNRQKTSYYTLDRRDNYLGTVQRYMLQSYIKQKDGNVGPNPVTNNYTWNYYKYESQYNSKGGVPTNAQTFANGLLNMLNNGFNNNTYNINKYKNFNPDTTYITTSSAIYDESSNRFGPFTVVNPNGYAIKVDYLKNNNAAIGYTVVDADGNVVNLSNTTTGTNFYLKLNNEMDGTYNLSTNFYIDFGDVPTARIFIPKKDTAQIMTSVDRVHRDKSVSKTVSGDVSKPDIALKKYILAVNGTAVQNRLQSIDLTPLANKTSSDALYYMNKTPIEVNAGDTITYAIRLFNEGEVNATAEYITDYLPSGMQFIRAYTDYNAVHTDGYDGSNDIENEGTSTSLKFKNPNTDYIAPYSTTDTQESFMNKSQVIYIDCKVATPYKNYVYTNVSEISEYRLEKGVDIDSSPANWNAPSVYRTTAEWQNYANGQQNWLDGGYHYFIGQEDEDDFDKVIIKNIDLALTKRIEGKLVEGTEEYLVPDGASTNKSRLVISGYDDVKNGTKPDLIYNMNKKSVLVQRENQLVTVLTVYNEGKIDGTVRQITDYLPAGLNYNAEKTAELYGVTPTYEDDSLVITSGDDTLKYTFNTYSRQLTILINGEGYGKTLKNLNDYDNDPNNHKVDNYEVKFVLDVSNTASGRLYNSAAITDYGYVGNDGYYYSAYGPGVDKDSFAMQDANNLKTQHQLKHKGAELVAYDTSEYDKNDLQYQDDDDMDVVEVDYNPGFDLSLRKFIYKVEKDFYSSTLVDENDPSLGYKKYSTIYTDRIPEINQDSFDELVASQETAEYYHEKLKVRTEKGDLVTYRIRVYNEGRGNDYFGRATEITDYLPNGLEYVSLEDGYASNWTASASGSEVTLTYTGSKILPTDSIEILANINSANEIKSRLDDGEEITQEEQDLYDEYINYNESDYYQEVGLICRVTSEDNYKVITNRAAITDREAYEKVYTDETNYNLTLKPGVKDLDNPQPDELTNPNLDNWYSTHVENTTTPPRYIAGEQDDDDFDTIYVDSYKVKIVKNDGNNILPGVKMKVYKYRHIPNPLQDSEQIELNDMEDEIEATGQGEYTSSAPTVIFNRTFGNLPTSIEDNGIENDIYVIREIEAVDGYYNPFEGKYIVVGFNPAIDGMQANYRVDNMQPLHVSIYNEDDDVLINYDLRDPYNVYHYVSVSRSDNNFTITIKNTEINYQGKYTVKLLKRGKKKDNTTEQIAGVQFDASGNFNNRGSVAIPHSGAKLESVDEGYVDAIPDSYTDGYIPIEPGTYGIADEISITETGIKEGATDSEGNLIDTEFYTGLLNKELKIKVNKTVATDANIELYYVDNIELTLNGESFTNSTTLENGSEVVVNFIRQNPVMDSHGGTLGPGETIIAVVITNPYIEKGGKYNLNLVKYKQGTNTPVAGVHFTASAHINGEDDEIAGEDNPITTAITPTKIEEELEIEEDYIDDPDTYTFNEIDVGSNSDIYVGITDPIELTVNKTIDKSDISNWVYKVSSVTMKIGDDTVTADSVGKRITVANGAQATIKFNSETQTIELSVSNPPRTSEGQYNIYLKKKGTDGVQLGGVQFDVKGYFNGSTTGTDIPSTGNKLETDANDWVEIIPESVATLGVAAIEIEPESYPTPDYITLKETGLADDAETENGDAVEGKYFLAFKDKEIKVIFNKDVDNTTDPTKDIYFVKSIELKIDDVTATRVNDKKYTYTDSDTGATITVELEDDNRIEIVVENTVITKEGTYSVNLLKYKKGSTTPVTGVHFTASAHINGTNETIAGDSNPLTTATTAVAVKSNAPMSEEKITENDTYTLTEKDVGTNDDIYVGITDPINLTVEKDIDKTDAANWKYIVKKVTMTIGEESVVADGTGKTITLDNGAEVTIKYNSTSKTIEIIATNPTITKEGTYHVKLVKYKQGSTTPVAGVKFTASAKVDDVQETIADEEHPLVTGTSAVFVKENAAMSEEKINVVDIYNLKEIDVGNNSDIYIGYTGLIGLTVKKKMDTSDPTKKVFLVDEVWLTINNERVEGNSITLDNGTEIKITYNESTKTIEISVTDPKKEGGFKLNLIKRKYNVDENNDGKNDPLAGAVFNVTVNDGTSDIKKVTNQTTNDDGEIPEISGISITEEDLTYTITVEEVSAPTGYIGIGAPVTFTAKSKFDGTKYVLDTETQPTIENEYIQAEVNEDEILIEAENRVEPVIHKGVKTVENQDSGYDKNEIQTWVINTSVPKGIKDYTKYIVTDTIDPEKTTVREKRIAFIDEDNPENNVVVKYKGTDTVLTNGTDYKVAFNKTTKELTITFINATEGNDNFVGGRSLTEETTLEITYKTQFTLDSNGDPIGLNQSIPNQAHLTYNGNGKDEKTKDSEEPEVHTGGLGVYKYDKATDTALVGARFRLVRTRAEAEAAVAALWAEDQEAIDAIDWVKKYNADGTVGDAWEVTTGSDGYTYFAGLEFGEDAEKEGASPKNEGVNGAPIYNYDWTTAQTTYYLVETYVPEDYVLLEQVAAECVVKKDSFVKTDLTKYHKVGNELVVPEGEYAIELAKYGKYENEDPHPIAGVVFSAKRKINGLDEEDLGNLTETDSTGRTVVKASDDEEDTVKIEREYVSTDDVYTIHEVSIPETSEYYVGLEKDIVLTVSKQSVKSEDKKKWLNSVTGINMTIEGETVTAIEAGKKYTATVTKDGQELEIVAELLEDEEGGQYIKLTVEDPHKVGDFKLNVIKTIKGTNPEKPLPGTGFKVSIKNGDEALVDGNGNVLDGTNEFFVNDNGELVFEDLNIKKPGLTYDVVIEESTVPTGYIGISDNIEFSAVSKVKGAKLGLEDKEETKISNDVVIKFEEDEIWVDVENKPEPVIHKGVRTIRNQDAGYDGDEIQTWVINSSIEAGIEDYTQYIITDEIDYEKTNVEEKRIEYIPGSIEAYVLDDYEGNKVKDLVENTDYEINFDDEKKIITITFINVDGDDNGFKAGRELPAGNIIEIKYNTKFRLDDNGLIIGLQQSIENEATLTFGVRNHEDNDKKSETPEVHTGAVGVIKYEYVNKNNEFDDEDLVLEGAHFKIVRTEEEADKALAAVLAGDEETLKTISFVKVRDEEGNVTDVDVELITDDHGKAIYEGLEFGENASDNEENKGPNGKGGFEVYEYDWETAKTEYYLVETEAPYDYYLMDHYDTFEVSKNSFVMLDETTYYKEADKPKIYDLSLRKFITHVNGTDVEGNEIDRNITDRIPQVTLTDEFKDKENEEVTTAIYEHTKEPVIVQQGNTVTYTIRVYNEGPEDAYASWVKDDIPDGVEFIPYTEGDGSVNDEYRWKLVDENDNEVTDMSKAKYIITDKLSMEQGKEVDGVNSNLIKGFDSDTMKELDYRDLKVQFYVTEPNTSERIITNYAQIKEMKNSDGKIETDRDSTPNEWIEGEDDQDVEHIRLLYFDLALRKWVTKAIVISDGEEKVFETGHKAEDDPEDVVKVDLKKSKINKVVVKFEYQIRITNEGRIGGWCDEITDHIPDGLTFDQADNPIWTVVNEKTITTDALKDTYLEPGESAEVTVVLRWENSGDNLGIKVNVAEISKDRNEYGVHDIDSTPGNYKWGEDDIDDAPVMLAITTGNMAVGYTILGLVVVSIITVGAIAIKKVRSEEDYF